METKTLKQANSRKTYYSIREVCAQTGLEPHVLRYWESEFSQLRPKKNRAGNRAYRRKDIDLIFFIKQLLYEDQYTIPGAKKKLAETKEAATPEAPTIDTTGMPTEYAQKIKDAVSELKNVLDLLEKTM